MDGFVARFNDLLFELRTWDTDRLRAERERVVVERRKLRTRELALTRGLDEREAIPEDQPARDGETEREAKRKRELAKKLEQLPALGNAAMDGRLSDGQLEPAVSLADEDSDEDVAASAPHTSPQDLQKMACPRRCVPSGGARHPAGLQPSGREAGREGWRVFSRDRIRGKFIGVVD